MLTPATPAPDPPAGLAAALAHEGASVDEGWREASRGYVRARAADGRRLFGRWSDDPDDIPVLRHEVAILATLSHRAGPLTAPTVVAQGPGWLLDTEIDQEPLTGEGVALAAAAGAEIPELVLPHGPGDHGGGDRFARRIRVLRSPLPARELLRARSLLNRTPLPPATSHGDLHGGNVLLNDGRAYVVDWELSGRRPLGWDLMQLWATVPDPADRPVVLEAALDLVGRAHRAALLELRYVLAVRTAASALTAVDAFDRDTQGGRRLVDELATLRG